MPYHDEGAWHPLARFPSFGARYEADVIAWMRDKINSPFAPQPFLPGGISGLNFWLSAGTRITSYRRITRAIGQSSRERLRRRRSELS